MFRILDSVLTIKDGKAVLSGRRQRLAGGVQLVAVVANADLELDGLTWLLEHARAMKHGAQGVFPPPLVFLHGKKRRSVIVIFLRKFRNVGQRNNLHSLYLCHQDVITGDVINILLNLSIQQRGQFHQDPPPVGDAFTLKQIIKYKSECKNARLWFTAALVAQS